MKSIPIIQFLSYIIYSRALISPSFQQRAATSLSLKRQTAVYDGSEFISLSSVLFKQLESNNNNDEDENSLQPLMESVPSLQAGYITFVTGTLDNERVLGIQVPNTNNNNDDDDSTNITSEQVLPLEETYIYKSSKCPIPNNISEQDAISTAAASLSSVYSAYDFDSEGNVLLGDKEKKAVVLGGGDYACFIAKALDALGVNTTMVTTRPMSLKDTPLNPLYQSNVEAMPPSVGEDDLGFSEALGTFDVVIDTLGDEANLDNVKYYEDGVDRVFGDVGVGEKLKRDNNCQRYLSTLTASQKIVLKEGILFARDPVLTYQKRIEKGGVVIVDPDDTEQEGAQCLPSPKNFGAFLSSLLQKNIVFPVDRNENGSHKNKEIFVKGCSFPDYAEVEIWPSSSATGANVRFGFPGIEELVVEAKMQEFMGPSRGKKLASKKKKTNNANPFVTEIESLEDVTLEIKNEKRDAVLFVSAPYCKLCRTMNPMYTRIARISKEDKDSPTLFAKASSAGKEGKQLTFTFKIDSVPTFVLFRKGEMYGVPFGVAKLPSKKLEKAIANLESGKEWDEKIIGMEPQIRRTKLT